MTKVDKILKNATVVTIDQNGTIIENGAVVVDKGIILDLGPTGDIEKKYISDDVRDFSGKILMPGFVNTHTHLAMTIYRGIADDIRLDKWLYDYIFPLEKRFTVPENVEVADLLAFVELIRGGTTTFMDMYYFQELTAKLAKKTGIRAVVSEGIINLPMPNNETTEKGFDNTIELLEKYENDSLISVAVGIHAPYTSDDNLIETAFGLAEKYDTLFHIHLAETKWEYEKCLKEKGKTPVQYLASLGALSRRTVAAHGIWLSSDDVRLMQEYDAAVAHNPECNMKISSGVAKIPELLKAGVRVGLGTDGVASNNNLSMLGEMHTMALLHKLSTMEPTVLPAREVVKIATIGGAKVLGKQGEIGSLERGKQADIIALSLDFPHTTPYYNVYSLIVYSMLGNEVSDVMVQGRDLMRNGELTTIDEKLVIRQARKISEEIKDFIRS